MKMMQFASGVIALVVCGSTLAIGCAGAGDEAKNDTPREEATSPETLTMDLDNVVARSAKLSPSLVRVDIYDRAGTPQFSVDYQLGSAEEETVRWTLLAQEGAEAQGAPVEGSLRPQLDELPTLENSIEGALYIQSKIVNSLQGQEYDNYGCDLPSWVWFGDSCGSNGACCDVHDACYAEHGCTASSWYWTWPGGDCDRCNGAVVSCIAFDNPGPSSCCAAGNCGQPR
ncbi:hypothetical protein [Sorangium sp. So ce124]|uniref:hypothetical protein n=1 Tax=Sorangium sp. So ce124 TaxID=3133280 RepID=UPI003F63C899